MYRKKGFTLIEIIITVTIMLMVFSYTIYGKAMSVSPSMLKLDEFLNDISYIKSISMSGKEAFIMIGEDKKRYYIVENRKKKEVDLEGYMEFECYTDDIIKFTSNHTKGNTISLIIKKGKKDIKYEIKIACITGRIRCDRLT